MRINTDSRLPGGAKPTVEWLESFKWAMGKRLSEIAIQLNGVTEGRLSAISNAYTAAPTAGTWAQGDFVRHSSPVEAGTAGSKYVIYGFRCVASGTPGTWTQCRELTGN